MMNLVDCLVNLEKQNSTPSYDVLFNIVEVFVRKMEILAEYHVPAIMEKCQNPSPKEEADVKTKAESAQKTEEATPSTTQEEASTLTTSASVASMQELAQASDAAKESGITSNEASIPYWPDPMPPCTLHDCKTYLRFLIPAVKMVIHGVRNSHLTKCKQV